MAHYGPRFRKNWRGKYTLLIGTMKSSGFVGKREARPPDSSRPILRREINFSKNRSLPRLYCAEESGDHMLFKKNRNLPPRGKMRASDANCVRNLHVTYTYTTLRRSKKGRLRVVAGRKIWA